MKLGVGDYLMISLGVLFIGLKLGDVITWSWWWVLSPFWIGLITAAIVFVGFTLYIRKKYKGHYWS